MASSQLQMLCRTLFIPHVQTDGKVFYHSGKDDKEYIRNSKYQSSNIKQIPNFKFQNKIQAYCDLTLF